MAVPRKVWFLTFCFLSFSLFASIWVAEAQGTDAKVVLEPGLPGDHFKLAARRSPPPVRDYPPLPTMAPTPKAPPLMPYAISAFAWNRKKSKSST